MIKSQILQRRKEIIIALLVLSVFSILTSPWSEFVDGLSDNWRSVLVLLSITEGLFISGLIIMATVVGYDLGVNPLKWKSHLKHMVKEIPNQIVFWIGFWVNAVGAFGTGLVILYGVIRVFPPGAWGLMMFGLFDIAVTLVLRYEILRLKQEV